MRIVWRHHVADRKSIDLEFKVRFCSCWQDVAACFCCCCVLLYLLSVRTSQARSVINYRTWTIWLARLNCSQDSTVKLILYKRYGRYVQAVVQGRISWGKLQNSECTKSMYCEVFHVVNHNSFALDIILLDKARGSTFLLRKQKNPSFLRIFLW